MSDQGDPRRDALHEFLQAQGPADLRPGALLTGWAIVTEWVDDEGEKWLSKGHAATVATWHAAGMYHAALYDDWPESTDE